MPKTIIVEEEALTGLTVEELHGSPAENYASDGYTSQRTFRVPWSQRHTFARRMMGGQSQVGEYVRYQLPHKDPIVEKARVLSAAISPWSEKFSAHEGDVTRIAYPYAQVTCEYDTKWFESFELGPMTG
jgi:hypothetical protein